MCTNHVTAENSVKNRRATDNPVQAKQYQNQQNHGAAEHYQVNHKCDSSALMILSSISPGRDSADAFVRA